MTRIVRVVPDVPSFSVDDGFAYSVPDGIAVSVGSLVRVPLGGRRVRGWVVDERSGDPAGLKQILSRSGDLAMFDRRLLEVLRWAALRYVAPLAALLAKTTPPNVARRRSWPQRSPVDPVGTPPSDAFVAAVRAGRRPPTEVWSGPGPWHRDIAATLAPILNAGSSALVVASTGVEVAELAGGLEGILGDRVVMSHPDAAAADQTKAWVEAVSRPGSIVVGTRAVAFWPLEGIGAALVVGEGRRGMKDKATPTTHAREVLVKRSQVERFGLILAGVVPTAEALAAGTARSVPASGRPWGQVELVDRRTEDYDGTLLGPTARAALRAAVGGDVPVLLFTHRRATAQRCGACRTLRTCVSCGSGVFENGLCRRCSAASGQCAECGFGRFEMLGSGVSRVAAEAGRVVGRDRVGEAGSRKPVVVGTERDLPGLAVGLTIVVDSDGPLMAPTYRAAEDGFRLLARAVAAAGGGRGRRGLLQTSNPDHPVLQALKRGDPIEFVQGDSRVRAAAGFPPGGEVLVLEVEDPPEAAHAELLEAVGGRAQVLGPADHRGRLRWLLQGSDLLAARVAVRSVVARWREGGARVRIDADPIDL